MAQQLVSRSPALGAPLRRTCPPCAFQKSKLLPIRTAPQNTTTFVPSSSPAQAARPLSRPLQSASDNGRSSSSPSEWVEHRDDLLWSFGTGLSAMALIVIFCTLLPATPDNRHLHFAVAILICARSARASASSGESFRTESRLVWSASVYDHHPTTRPPPSTPWGKARRLLLWFMEGYPPMSSDDQQPSSTPWAKALHELTRFKNGDPPTSSSEVAIHLMWDLGTGLLGVVFLAYTLPLIHTSTDDTFGFFQAVLILTVCRAITPRR